jgi:hypothetical protein
MKLLTTTLLIASLSVAAFADKTANFNEKKEKRITKITQNLTKVQNRKSCMQNASSLEGMQSCRVEKNKNKPFKLKKGMTFQQKQSKIVTRISNRISKITQRKTCVQNSLNIADLKACKPQRKAKK